MKSIILTFLDLKRCNLPMTTKQRQQLLDDKAFRLSCIVPVHNEEAGIATFVPALIKSLETITPHYEIILIDDGSKDQSRAIIEEQLLSANVKLIAFSRNFGKEQAITAGLAHASGDATLIIDADFQHPFHIIPKMLARWTEGYDMAYGVRSTREDETPSKRIFTGLFYKVMGLMSEVKIPPDAGDFRLLDKQVVQAINQCQENSRFMKGLYAWVGYRSIAIPFKPKDRFAGQSSWHFFKLFDLALTGVISFSDFPLRAWSLIGVAISSISLIYALWIVLSTLIFGVDVPGYATIITAVIFFGGIQLLSVGIMGEYIARIFREVKRRPPFIIAKKIGFDE
jgi:polyisoprenyl-phosphate glycosyltransferase